MANPLLLAVFIFALFLFLAFYFVSSALYKFRHKQKYHFYQMFPYELNYPSVFKDNPYGNILFILGCVAVSAFYILNPLDSIYRIMAIVAAIIFTALLVCLLLIPLYYLRTHMFLSVGIMVLPIALTMFNFFLAFNKYKIETDQIQIALCIISMVLSGIMALTSVLLILNPKLTFKIYLEKADDGSESLRRPKIIYLALTEWCSIFIFFLSPLAVLLINLI